MIVDINESFGDDAPLQHLGFSPFPCLLVKIEYQDHPSYKVAGNAAFVSLLYEFTRSLLLYDTVSQDKNFI